MIGEIELRVRAANSIVAGTAYVGGALTIDEDRPDVRPLKNVPLHAQNRELLTRNAETRRGLAQLACLHLQESDVVWTNFAGDFHAVVDRHGLASICQTNAPREEGMILSLPAKEKNSRVLKKKVTLLREEDGESREVDGLIVYFRLTKVGIDGKLSGERRRDPKLGDFDSYIAAQTSI